MRQKSFYILSVAPIIASKLPEKFLSYVSDTDLPAGSLIQAPLRNKRVCAIVFSSQSAENFKIHLKKAHFVLKPIGPTGPIGPICSPEFLSFLQEAADYYVTHPGAILSSIIPVSKLLKGLDIQNIFEKRLKEYAKKISSEELDTFKQLRYPYINIKTLLVLAQKKLGIGFISSMGRIGHIEPMELVSWPLDFQLWLSHSQLLPPDGRTLIFINRKGATPVVYCQDCGRAQLCENCDVPLVMHLPELTSVNASPGNFFVCHHCGKSAKGKDVCKYCSSWRLKPYGIGIQQVEKWLLDSFCKTYRLDKTTASTFKKAREIYNRFLSEKNAVLLATQLIFSLQPEKFDNIFLLFPEQILNLPEFLSPEKLLRTVQKLSNLSKNGLKLCTKIPNHPLLKAIASGNVEEYIKQDLRLRKTLDYPPFKKLIKITLSHRNKEKLLFEKNDLEKQFENWKLSAFGGKIDNFSYSSYPAFIPRVKNVYRWHVLLKLDPEKNYPELSEFLYSLPPSIKIDVDPETLL